MNLFIDIESIPSQHPDALAQVRTTIKAPATLKKAESIAAWWATEADGAAQEVWRKQSLDGGTMGEIISVAVTDGDGRVWARCRAVFESEALLLADFTATVESWTRDEFHKLVAGSDPRNYFPADDHRLVAHNAAFDVGFLWRRMAVNGLRIPRWLPPPSARPGRDYGCTMMVWAGYGGRISLDALCKALNVPSPKDGGMDGSKVFDAWLNGQHAAIASYNMADARAVADVWHRLQTVGAV